jgi:hypothetical protein
MPFIVNFCNNSRVPAAAGVPVHTGVRAVVGLTGVVSLPAVAGTVFGLS